MSDASMSDEIPFRGLMMNRPLLLKDFFEGAERYHGDRPVVSFREGVRSVRTLAETVQRARRLASSLSRLGIRTGDRVATFCWNTQEHLELHIAVPAMGAVLHSINIRIHADEIAYVVGHAGDKILFADGPLAARLPTLSSVETEVIVAGVGDERPDALDYERLIADGDPGFEFPTIPEDSAAGMCYTGGTTGLPKGVVYSHRSTVLHTVLESLPDFYAFRRSDVLLPIVPMFHANAWGLPYAAFMTGASLVLPGDDTSPEVIASLIASEKVTFAAGVTTVWHGIAYLDELPDMSSLREVVAGGSAVSEDLMRRLDAVGIPSINAYGMTELNPLLSVGRPGVELEPGSDEWMSSRLSLGRPLPLVDAAIDEEGDGELILRGNTVVSAYYDAPDQNVGRFNDEGWMRTGDIVTLDVGGEFRLIDRTKDLVKSGGEWIPSVALENAIVAHPDVHEASVVAVADARWGERPYAFVVLRAGVELTTDALVEFLVGRVSRWWLPERFEVVPQIPKTSVGKADKKALRVHAEDAMAHAGRTSA